MKVTPLKKTPNTVGLLSLGVLTVGSLSLTAQRPQNQSAGGRMSGTYDLESTRGGTSKTYAETATRSLPPGQRERAYRSLVNRLEPPHTLSIDRIGRTITIASSLGPRSSFVADGRAQTERGLNGRMVTTRAEIDGNQLKIRRAAEVARATSPPPSSQWTTATACASRGAWTARTGATGDDSERLPPDFDDADAGMSTPQGAETTRRSSAVPGSGLRWSCRTARGSRRRSTRPSACERRETRSRSR